MKRPLHAYTLNPSAGTLDLSGIPNFDIRNLFGVVHLPTGVLIYAPTPGATYASISGGVLHLKVPVFAFSASDPLLVIYDDGGKPAEDTSVAAVGTALAALTTANHTDLGAILAKLGTRLSVSLDGDSVTLTLPPGLAQDASLQSLIADVASNHADLQALHADVGGTLHADFGALLAKDEAIRALLAAALTINLPVGAATSAAQATANTALASILAALGPLATDADLQATTAKVEAVRALLAGTLKTAPQANAPRVSNTAALAAQGATVTLAVDGMATGVAQITGAWAGSVSWAGSIDGGASYFAMNVTPFGAGGGASIGAATANGQWEFSAAGLTHVQATMTAWTSGSASVLLAASSGGKIARVKAPAGDPLPTLDQNGAAFGTAAAMTAGQTYTAARSVGINATAAGNITLTTSGGSTITLPIYVGWNTYPFAVTSFSWPASGAGAGAVFNLN